MSAVRVLWSVLLILGMVGPFEVGVDPTPNIIVTTNSDVMDAETSCLAIYRSSFANGDGLVSLREALCAANNTSGADVIEFNIPEKACTGPDGACIIAPTSNLPSLLDNGTSIQGYTQPGSVMANAFGPAEIKIIIDGNGAGDVNGISINSANNQISGLVIARFQRTGIRFWGSGATGNSIWGNHIGTDDAGTGHSGNAWHGISIEHEASLNTIGGSSAQYRNVIAWNGYQGVNIQGTGTMTNTVSGNYIGLLPDGTTTAGNAMNGVLITGDSQNNTIGGDVKGEGNVISENGENGVKITGSLSSGNLVSGNIIGLNAAGDADKGNDQDGVTVHSTNNITIGGDTSGERNVISGNGYHGVSMSNGASGVTVIGNYIGLSSTGSTAFGNDQDGVRIANVSENTIGGDSPAERNVISGNYTGINISGSTAISNTVTGNYIGTDVTGELPRGNLFHGMAIKDGANHNIVGGITAETRNVISGNDSYGIHIHGTGTEYNQVIGNYIGVDVDGDTALGNGSAGIYFEGGCQHNQIGGGNLGEGNVLSANSMGIMMAGTGISYNTIAGNLIGLDASGQYDLGNTEDGIYLTTGPSNNTIGGDTPGEANTIGFNDSDGVDIVSSGSDNNIVKGNYIGTDSTGTLNLGNNYNGVRIISDAQDNTIGPGNIIANHVWDGVRVRGGDTNGNTITQNSIYSNNLGIFLYEGGNEDTPAPTITSVSFKSDGTVDIEGTACYWCTVEVFSNSDNDGEGETYVGEDLANGSGFFSLTVNFSDLAGKFFLTATATDTSDGTSEFSSVFEVKRVFLPLVVK